jgi:hypothetical protein
MVYEAALRDIACFADAAGNNKLKQVGEYGAFQEPSSVKIAREALIKGEKIAEETEP